MTILNEDENDHGMIILANDAVNKRIIINHYGNRWLTCSFFSDEF